jgi:quinolinate synthase
MLKPDGGYGGYLYGGERHSLCPDMYKINLDKLLYSIQDIGGTNRIAVADDLKQDARLALDRMPALAP